jgi:hypothetical protein
MALEADERASQAEPVLQWLLGGTRAEKSLGGLIAALCLRLCSEDVPVARCVVQLRSGSAPGSFGKGNRKKWSRSRSHTA